MLNYIKNAIARKDGEEGFSLIELIVVVAILGILVAIAIPVYGNIQTTARHTALQTSAANAATSMAAALAQGGVSADVLADLNATGGTTVYAEDSVAAAVDAIDVKNTSTDDVFVSVTNAETDEAWAGTLVGSGFVAA